jgi:molecular chaperone GrpE (heat shock protein)
MSSEIEELRKQLQEAQRLREEEQRLREEAQRHKQETERLREQERHQYKRRTRKTTLPEFLDACHAYLYSGLTIQPDSTQSTQGDTANTENKPCPDRILP